MTDLILTSSYSGDDDDASTSFVKRIKSQGGETIDGLGVEFHSISVNGLMILKRLSALVAPPVMSAVPKNELLSAVPRLVGVTKDGKKRVLDRQTFESLVQLGFGLASKDYVLIDTPKEAAFKDIILLSEREL
eukprot:CAMPEP_0181050956 /NCGR_PEP_ID=MMETSP1070-20121207/16795_1 /TAXON_ID=265543 /ORGANISM="Minutocellus polymorphus, Strain NH13" /LENGTH=132 /DNA_ID=CAMNT_0023129941 /DNA_START=287 /DNA_END=682 /DNA_ORIENTATION=-